MDINYFSIFGFANLPGYHTVSDSAGGQDKSRDLIAV